MGRHPPLLPCACFPAAPPSPPPTQPPPPPRSPARLVLKPKRGDGSRRPPAAARAGGRSPALGPGPHFCPTGTTCSLGLEMLRPPGVGSMRKKAKQGICTDTAGQGRQCSDPYHSLPKRVCTPLPSQGVTNGLPQGRGSSVEVRGKDHHLRWERDSKDRCWHNEDKWCAFWCWEPAAQAARSGSGGPGTCGHGPLLSGGRWCLS